MNSFKELIFSFFEASRERLKNPAVGTFIIVWIAINWRFISVLFFSKTDLEDRISLIEECYLRWDLNILYPLLAMIAYMLIPQNLMALFDALSQKAISFRKEISNKNKLEDMRAKNKHRLEDVVAQQEIASEERQLEIIEEGNPEVSKIKEQLSILKKENEELKDQLSNKPEEKVGQPKQETTITTDSNHNQTKEKPSSRKQSTKKPKSPNENDNTPSLPTSSEYPAMRDNVIRNVAKSEKEWILIYGFYSSNFGKKEFTRKELLAAYDETKRKTTGRRNNLTNNINTLVKQGLIRFLNDEEMLLTDQGKSLSEEILNR